MLNLSICHFEVNNNLEIKLEDCLLKKLIINTANLRIPVDISVGCWIVYR